MKTLPAEIELVLKSYGRYIAFLRRHPTHAVRSLFGIVIPPHESVMLEQAWMRYRNYVYKCSRGTSKTFTIGSLFGPLTALLFRGVGVLIASASRFRGGKLVLKDSERLINGRLSAQKMRGRWVKAAVPHTSTIRHEPDMWTLEFKSHSSVFTVPTNNEDALRGIRANILIIDERNTFGGDAIETVYKPFLAVGTTFDRPAEGAESNQIFTVGTIDYSYRDWHKEIQTTKDIARLQYQAQQAMMTGDWDTYDDILARHGARLHNLSLCYTRFDYTDLLIPTQIGKYKVNYPGAELGRDIKQDLRDNCDLIYTYPVNKRQLESDLDEGIADTESWEAEHRNVFIRASGSVYPPALVEKVTGPIFTATEEEKRRWKAEDSGSRYLPPVLYECGDPCVLGVDTARTSDFTAMVVIRVGMMPEDYFNTYRSSYSLTDHGGATPWANVIWAEQHQHMTAQQTSELIKELRNRYHIVGGLEFPGLAMDARGGGVHVRDQLANPSPPIDSHGKVLPGWKQPQKVFDPEDDEFQYLLAEPTAWPGLRLLNITDMLNQELIGFSRAQMDIGRLYIGAYKPQNERHDPEHKMSVGYLGVRALKHQMLRIQAEPTASGKSVRFVMPGDSKRAENKKDVLSAFLYACFALRAVINKFAEPNQMPEPVAYGTTMRL